MVLNSIKQPNIGPKMVSKFWLQNDTQTKLCGATKTNRPINLSLLRAKPALIRPKTY